MSPPPSRPTVISVLDAIRALKAGSPVALPTETVYGLAADIENERALRKIFEWKGRPSQNPLIVHVAYHEICLKDGTWLNHLIEKGWVQLDSESKNRLTLEKLARAFWPGPMTLLLPKGPNISKTITANSPYVAIRIPSHPVFQEILTRSGLALAAPSANLSGRPSATDLPHLLEDFKHLPLLAVDGGPSKEGLESTILKVSENDPTQIEILRPGSIGPHELKKLDLHSIEVPSENRETDLLLSPGQLSRHYAIATPTFWLDSRPPLTTGHQGLFCFSPQSAEIAEKLGQFTFIQILSILPDDANTWKQAATNLYRKLRELESRSLDSVWVERLPVTSNLDALTVRGALLNRLEKAVRDFRV